MAAISLKNLQKTYRSKSGNGKVALKNINLEVPEGSFFGLLGPNGAGKSTLINILSGMVIKSSGEVRICGYDIDRQDKQARSVIGVVPQELVLDPFFTPYQVLENTAGYYGLRKKDRRTDEIIAAVGLSEKAHSAARSLSGGMRRRLLVAKALVHAPQILVLDEPTAGVDVELREQLWAYVRKLNRAGTTILLTTHYLEEAQELCDQIAVINHGDIIANDTTRSLMKIIDRKKLIVTPAKAVTKIPAFLKKWEGKINEEGQIEIGYKSKDTTVQEILSAIFEAGIVVQDISTQEAGLEDVFKYLTKKKAD
jgi:ABC-2 type transport system ATP-binding protein